ncbi:MAG: metallophosphoesterase [Prolixibacteraceae bacterium]|nr:metallophosphoesterase [Prolixibacteraceae bacterium]
MIKKYFFVLLILLTGINRFVYPQGYSFLVAGHAYGSHSGENVGMHPPFVEKLYGETIRDTNIFVLFLTGDIVNHSNEASWQQVEAELAPLPFQTCYVMGNHDDNATGTNVFIEKHGSTWYAFSKENDLFVVLNSTISDRSVSSDQLEFLENLLLDNDGDDGRVFIFFHEVLWNSLEKYKGVRSNSRSRYDQMHLKSNFWTEVFPLFSRYPAIEFYCFSGDVGGNTDAISLFYDKIENVTLIASGMGEVPDENYLKIDVMTDTVMADIIPLNDDIVLLPIEYYAVPETPDSIFGPVTVNAGDSGIIYSTSPVFNATVYRWELPPYTSGIEDGNEIELSFDSGFETDTLRVFAQRDGYGESQPAWLVIGTDTIPDNVPFFNREAADDFQISLTRNEIVVRPVGDFTDHSVAYFYSLSGKQLNKQTLFPGVENSISLPVTNTFILVIESGRGRSVYKIGSF